jgi:hypothetical protein
MKTILRALLLLTQPIFQPAFAPVRVHRSQRNYFSRPGMKSR